MPKYYSMLPNGSFQILKRKNNKIYYYGVYKTEKDAQKKVEFLKAHDWDLKYVIKRNNRNHVYYKYGKYRIYKNKTYYGSYSTRKEADKAVEFFEQHDWDKNYVKYLRDMPHYISKYVYLAPCGKYVIEKNIDGRTEYYGSFPTLEEAESERDLLVKCNWDWDLIVEQE